MDSASLILSATLQTLKTRVEQMDAIVLFESFSADFSVGRFPKKLTVCLR
jgi:hypothetical protein